MSAEYMGAIVSYEKRVMCEYGHLQVLRHILTTIKLKSAQ
jgi:hypothetical protein